MQHSYQTKQRDAIIKCLNSHLGESISAKEIYSLCDKNNTHVGLATIYRQLEKLILENKVKKITLLLRTVNTVPNLNRLLMKYTQEKWIRLSYVNPTVHRQKIAKRWQSITITVSTERYVKK